MKDCPSSFLLSEEPQTQEYRPTVEDVEAFAALPSNAGYSAASRGEPRQCPDGIDDAEMWLEGYDLFCFFNSPQR